MSAAFDTVDHVILIQRLEMKYGFHDATLEWIKSYLCNRMQTVVINETESLSHTMSRGVPQDSVLDPMLFLLYTSEIQEIINSFCLLSHVYADDTQLYFHCHGADCSAMY